MAGWIKEPSPGSGRSEPVDAAQPPPTAPAVVVSHGSPDPAPDQHASPTDDECQQQQPRSPASSGGAGLTAQQQRAIENLLSPDALYHTFIGDHQVARAAALMLAIARRTQRADEDEDASTSSGTVRSVLAGGTDLSSIRTSQIGAASASTWGTAPEEEEDGGAAAQRQDEATLSAANALVMHELLERLGFSSR